MSAISDEELAELRSELSQPGTMVWPAWYGVLARLDAAEADLLAARREAEELRDTECLGCIQAEAQLASASAVVEAARGALSFYPHLRELRDALATHDATAGAEGEGEG